MIGSAEKPGYACPHQERSTSRLGSLVINSKSYLPIWRLIPDLATKRLSYNLKAKTAMGTPESKKITHLNLNHQ
ncbi:hypothetical protein TNCV_417491 [Trichonephila clavipes]|nr:hypothetical protein TNCV_417491 [Trichonephila clavipes]